MSNPMAWSETTNTSTAKTNDAGYSSSPLEKPHHSETFFFPFPPQNVTSLYRAPTIAKMTPSTVEVHLFLFLRHNPLSATHST